MGIYRRKRSPYYWAAYYDSSGRRQRKSTRKTDRRAAQIWLAAKEVQASRETAGSPVIVDRSLRPAVAEFLAEKEHVWSAGWWRTVNYWWSGLLLDAIGEHTEVSSIDAAAVGKLRAAWLTNHRPSTVNRITAVGSAFFRWAIRNRYAAENPFRGHEHLREPRKPPPYLSAKQVDRFLAQLDPELRRRAAVAVDTAIRRSELERLTFGDVDGGVLTVASTYERGTTKTGKMRRIPLTPRAAKAIGPGRPDAVVFGHLPATATRIALHAAQDRSGTPRFRWHDLRHFALTRLAESGATVRELMEFAGWGSPAMASRYIHTDTDRLAVVVARMAGVPPVSQNPSRSRAKPASSAKKKRVTSRPAA